MKAMEFKTRGSEGLETAGPETLKETDRWVLRGRWLEVGKMTRIECLQAACDLRDEMIVAERYLKAFEEYIEQRFGSDG